MLDRVLGQVAAVAILDFVDSFAPRLKSRVELYDLVDDPGELVNRWADPAYASLRSDLVATLRDSSARRAGRGNNDPRRCLRKLNRD